MKLSEHVNDARKDLFAKIIQHIPRMEIEKPLFVIDGKVYCPKDLIKLDEKTLSKLGAMIEKVKGGQSIKDLLTEDEQIQLCIERYKFLLNQTKNERAKVYFLSKRRAFAFQDIIKILESKSEPYKIFISAMCKYIDWLIRRG